MGNIKHCDVEGCTSTSEEVIQGSWWKVQRMDDDYSGKHDLCPKHAQLLESMEWKTGENGELLRQLAEANEAADGQRGIESSWKVTCLEGPERYKVLSPEADLKGIKLIQVRIFYDESTQDLWVERHILLLGSSERSKILEWIQGESAEGVAEYMAKQVDAVLSRSQLFHFATGSVGGLDWAAQDVANLQDGLHEFFIGGPTEKLASALGLPYASLIGDVAGSLPLPFDRLMGGFRLACEIGAVATVMVTGPTPLVFVGEKLLVKDVVHKVVVESIIDLLPGDGKQRQVDGRAQERQVTDVGPAPIGKLIGSGVSHPVGPGEVGPDNTIPRGPLDPCVSLETMHAMSRDESMDAQVIRDDVDVGKVVPDELSCITEEGLYNFENTVSDAHGKPDIHRSDTEPDPSYAPGGPDR